jgi:hypothetical protein
MYITNRIIYCFEKFYIFKVNIVETRCIASLLEIGMKRIKINTTWEEDEEERRQFFASLSYSERLRYCFKLKNKFNFNKKTFEKGKVFKIYHSYDG